jgi:hypothetical protein
MKEPPDDKETGLPGLCSWGRVYWVVLGILAAWIVLLTALTRLYS